MRLEVIAWLIAAERENIRSIKHGYNPEATTVWNGATVGKAKRIRAVDAEAIVGATDNAGEILIERYVQELSSRIVPEI
jgi:hypothetical protein